MSYRENITRIKAIYNALGDMCDQVVFVGGATVSLYATRESADVRPTEDVDIVVEVMSRSDFSSLEQKLRERGFSHAVQSDVICRYQVNGIIVDVMPSKDNIIGFSNSWYDEGFKSSIRHQIDELHTVSIFTAPYFLASKLVAFKNRGKNDGRLSSDFEDIVYLLNNRDTLFEEIESAPESVGSYLKVEFRRLLKNMFFQEWINAHLDYNEQSRADMILNGLREITNNP
jgi:predicted nucleotidyltransferase